MAKGLKKIVGSNKADVLIGTDSNDLFFGKGGIDEIFGNSGDDRIEAGTGDDFVDGGPGFDIISYVNATGPVSVDLRDGFASGADGFDTIVNVEAALGSDFETAVKRSDVLHVDDSNPHATIVGDLADGCRAPGGGHRLHRPDASIR